MSIRYITVSFLAIFLAIHTANTYILLTANLEDVQAIAKQLSNSPVAEQINKIWRRATNQFNTHIIKPKPIQRTREDDEIKIKFEAEASPDRQIRAEEAEPARNEELHESYLSGHEDPQQQILNLEGRRRRRNDPEEEQKKKEEDEDLVALGRNASVYLKSIRRIFQDM